MEQSKGIPSEDVGVAEEDSEYESEDVGPDVDLVADDAALEDVAAECVQEIENIRNYTCPCKFKLASGETVSCIRQFTEEQIFMRRLEISELTSDEKDFYVKGLLDAMGVSASEMTLHVRESRRVTRKRKRRTYQIKFAEKLFLNFYDFSIYRSVMSASCLYFVIIGFLHLSHGKSLSMETPEGVEESNDAWQVLSDSNITERQKNTSKAILNIYSNFVNKMGNDRENISAGNVASRQKRSIRDDYNTLTASPKWKNTYYLISKSLWVNIDEAQRACEVFDASLAEIDDYDEKSYLANFYYRITDKSPNCWADDPLFYISPVDYNPAVARFQYKYSRRTVHPGVYNGQFGTIGATHKLALFGRMQLKGLEEQEEKVHFICEASCPNWFFCR